MNFTMTQLWLAAGIILIILELVSTTFVVLFFGIAALCVALVASLGVESLSVQLALFAVLGAAGIVLFRKKVGAAFAARGEQDKFSGMQNKRIILDHDVPAGGRASVLHQGTTWTAINEGSTDLKSGSTVMIVRVDGVKLVVAPESQKS